MMAYNLTAKRFCGLVRPGRLLGLGCLIGLGRLERLMGLEHLTDLGRSEMVSTQFFRASWASQSQLGFWIVPD